MDLTSQQQSAVDTIFQYHRHLLLLGESFTGKETTLKHIITESQKYKVLNHEILISVYYQQLVQ